MKNDTWYVPLNNYSKLEYKKLLQIKNEWNDIALNYDTIVDVVIDINLFKKNYNIIFPESKTMIQENEVLLDSLNFSLVVFNKILKKETFIEYEFNKALEEIESGFQSLLFDLKYKDGIMSDGVF